MKLKNMLDTAPLDPNIGITDRIRPITGITAFISLVKT